MPVIIPSNTKMSYLDVYNTHIAPKCTNGNTLENADFPWVKHRNLYLTTYQTGKGSWEPALAHAKGQGAKQVYVLTGRHGDQYGGMIDANGHFNARTVQAPDHFIQDQALALNLTSSQCKVNVIDIGCDPKYNTIQGMKGVIDKLTRTEFVICAWCFSLLAMYWYKAVLEGTTELNDTVAKHMKEPISSIISSKWSWVH